MTEAADPVCLVLSHEGSQITLRCNALTKELAASAILSLMYSMVSLWLGGCSCVFFRS